MNHIYDYLKLHAVGRMRAVKARHIAHEYGMTIREVNSVVRELRNSGVIIGSSKRAPHGYYLPANEHEARACILTYKAEVMDMLQVLNRMKKSINVHYQSGDQYQLPLFREMAGAL